MYGMGGGIRQGIGFSDLRRLRIAVPPLDEQRAIARFLDRKSRRIARFIHARQRMIALLNEQKQAIIHQAVTRGLDPNIPLKPSGIDWLGDIPAHWTVRKLGQLARIGNGSTPSRSQMAYWTDGHFPWLNSSVVNSNPVLPSQQFVTDLALKECHLPVVPPGSVLIGITGQGKTRGMSSVLPFESTINQHVAFVSPRDRLLSSDYVQAVFTAAYSRLREISDGSGSTKGALTCEDLKQFPIPLPSPNEQEQLVEQARRLTAEVERTAIRYQSEIELLREYRTRLIADVVTGKLDIRDHPDAAEDAPDDLGDSESLDGILDGDVPVGDIEDDGPVDEVAG